MPLLRRPRVANFANIIKVLTMFIKTSFKGVVHFHKKSFKKVLICNKVVRISSKIFFFLFKNVYSSSYSPFKFELKKLIKYSEVLGTREKSLAFVRAV